MLPFTVEQFLNVFAEYNRAVRPMQVILTFLAGAAIFLALKPNSFSNRLITVLLACFWLWTGVVYHLAFFSRINRAAYLFGILCIVQAVVFLFAGLVGRSLTFRSRWDAHCIVGGVFILYALLIYPLLSNASGHNYPYSPTFGAPCPITIFTFGLLLWADGIVPRYVLWIPLVWSLVGNICCYLPGHRRRRWFAGCRHRRHNIDYLAQPANGRLATRQRALRLNDTGVGVLPFAGGHSYVST